MKTLVILSFFCLAVNAFRFNIPELPLAANGTNWAFLAAGGNGFSLDWAIQADVYHAYQVFLARGIPAENIIVMHLDNIANKKTNPTPGQVINVVGGPDVYKGVPKHYVGADVTGKNFLGVLRGDKQLEDQGKKVLKSGPNDNVFVYFMDHGGTRLVSFPHGGYMYAQDLINTLKQMHTEKKFAQLVFYLEACESGSMFNGLLPEDINIYAVTSSAPTQNSWACYYDEKYKEYLAGYFAANWLKNTEDVQTETLDAQFTYIKEKTGVDYVDPYSHQKWHQDAQHYGDLAIAQKDMGLFEGTKAVHPPAVAQQPDEIVSFRDIPVRLAQKKIAAAVDNEEKLRYVEELEQILMGRQLVDKHLEQYVNSIGHLTGENSEAILSTQQEVSDDECYRKFVDTFSDKCFNLNENPYVLGKLNVFVNICEQLSASEETIALNQLIGHCETTALAGRPQHIV